MYGGLNENVSQRLMYTNIYSPAGGTVYGGLTGVALLDEMPHLRRVFESS